MKTTAVSKAFRFRWINGQCFEIQLPGGTNILTDPFYPSLEETTKSDEPLFKYSGLDVPFSVDDLEKIDYVILNHTHFDHIMNLQEVVDKYHPIVIVHSSMAVELAKYLDLTLSNIYPVDFNSTYYFPGFTLDTFHGLHHPVRGNYAEEYRQHAEAVADERMHKLSALGGLLNMNFIIETPEHFSVAFVGGNIDGDFEIFRKHHPSILFRNKLHSSKTEYDVAKVWAEYLAETRIPLMVPMHHEKWFVSRPGFTEQMVEDMNRELEHMGSTSRVLDAKRTKWYTMGLAVME